MGENILFALWFFLPAGVANMTPILVAKLPVLKNWNTPIDLGKSWRGTRIFGDHKTWRGLVCGVIAGIAVVAVQSMIWSQSWWSESQWLQAVLPPNADYLGHGQTALAVGVALGMGALLGDAIKSFFKRRSGVPSGKSWFPFDQLDYVVGGLLLSAPFAALAVKQYVWIVVTWFGMHLLFSYLGYRLHLKKDPI